MPELTLRELELIAEALQSTSECILDSITWGYVDDDEVDSETEKSYQMYQLYERIMERIKDGE